MLDSSLYRIPTPGITFNPPIYYCLTNTKHFSLDGNIQKDFWDEIPYTCDFTDISGPDFPTPRFRTRAKMCWDENNLYVAALLEGDEIWAHVTDRDAVIFADNDFEIFIDPDSDTQQYYEFEMNARNTVWDLFLTKAYRDHGSPINSWDIKGLRTAVHIDGKLNRPGSFNRSWSVEVVLPFTSLMECTPGKNRPLPDEYWRMNFSRVQWQVDIEDDTYKKKMQADGFTPLPEDNWVWAPTGVVNIHYPELWGFVFFVDSPSKKPVIPDIEQRKWILRELYYMEHRHYDEYGCFLRNPQVRLPFPITVQITDHTFEISCRTKEDAGTLYILSDGKTVYIPDRNENL